MTAAPDMPPAVRTIADCEVQAAGHTWDAVRVGQPAGVTALAILSSRSGAVIADPFERVLYWFVPVGTAHVWKVPNTRALGIGQYLTVPPSRRTRGPGPHWRICPADGLLLTDVDALRAALHDAAGPRSQICTRCQHHTVQAVPVAQIHGAPGAGRTIYACPTCAPHFPTQRGPFDAAAAAPRRGGQKR